MGLAEWWYSFRTTRLSKPAEDRCLFRATQGRVVQSVLEVGIEDPPRCEKLIPWLLGQQEGGSLRYAAIDMFEAGGGISLKQFHALVTRSGAKPLPIPGELASGLPRVAHTIGAVDLMFLSQDEDQLQDPSVAAFLPRVLHDDSVVIVTDRESGVLYELPVDELLGSERLNRAAA